MKSAIRILTFITAIGNTYGSAVRLSGRNQQAIPGQYVIQLAPNSTLDSLEAHHLRVRTLTSRSETSVKNTFQIGEFKGYTGVFDSRFISDIASLPEVISIEPDYIIAIPDTIPGLERREMTTQSNGPWHLGDLSHIAAGSTDYVFDASAGAGMVAYVLDTGIRLSHEEFEGRAIFGFNAPLNSTVQNGTNSDTDSHGTHVAGIIAGKTYGVAKQATVVDVKIFLDGAGALSWGLAGFSWAVNDIISKGAQNSSVINLSIATTTTSLSWDNAVTAAYQLGIVATVAAGNNDGPASEWTPARTPASITVGMTDSSRSRVSIIEGIYGSNYGPELDLFAPGRDIISASYLSDTGLLTKTGTSMAAPLVAGLICSLRAATGGLSTPDEVLEGLVQLAHKDVVANPKGSVNLLVYNGSGL